MESWCFDSMDKGFVSTEVISAFDSINRYRGEFMGGGYKPSLSYENSGSFPTIPSQQFVENHCFPDMGIVEMIDDYASFGDVISLGVIASDGVSGDEESSSKVSSNVIDSNSQESSLIDLKLDGFGDELGSYSTRTAHVLFSVESSTPQKRARATCLSSQIVYCQVYGCLKDLSSAKAYHKRHKVCDVHSKTSKVIVNGVEQRFCQQCSRFHLLGEFDDRKRSCRKRLAGHNERRRKPQVGFSSISGTSFQSYTGSNFQGLNPRSTSVGCQDMLRRGTSHMEKYEVNDWVRQIKIEDGARCTQTPAYNSIPGQLHPNSTSPSHIFEQQFPFIDNKNNSNLKSVIEENVNPSMPEIVSHSLFQTKSPGSEDLTLLNEESTIEGLQGISESSRALSLLSSKSRDTLCHSFRLPVDPPLFTSPSNNPPQYSGIEASGERYGDQNRYPLFKINPTRENQPSSMLARNFGAFGNVARQSSKFMNLKNCLLLEDRNSIDLLQLSSQLHRLENQRQSEPLKQEETESFFCLK